MGLETNAELLGKLNLGDVPNKIGWYLSWVCFQILFVTLSKICSDY